MIDHAACARAVIESRRRTERSWYCARCQHHLATGDLGSGGVIIDDSLRRLERDHDGMARFGQSPRERRGRGADSATTIAPTRRLPFFAYCPRAGCGLGQHVEY